MIMVGKQSMQLESQGVHFRYNVQVTNIQVDVIGDKKVAKVIIPIRHRYHTNWEEAGSFGEILLGRILLSANLKNSVIIFRKQTR
jgi:hypothetical protein